MNLTGQSGTIYAFQVYPLGTPFKEVGGVYVISRRTAKADGGGNHDIYYVGQTSTLAERFNDHHKAEHWERREANCISVFVEENERVRLAIEADLVAAFNPCCNG
jgi:hypothetical protein